VTRAALRRKQKKGTQMLKVKIRIDRLHQMRDALLALESGDRVERADNGVRVVREPFALGALRFDIAKNLRRIKDALDVFEQGKLALIKECSNGKTSISKETDPDAWAKFEPEIEKRFLAEEEIEPVPLPMAALNIDKNPIPIIALAALDEIIQ
jgi:hypothetical protein